MGETIEQGGGHFCVGKNRGPFAEAEVGGYLLAPESFIASGGGVPLMLRGGTLIGTADVSGLSYAEDHFLVINALRKLRK
jgi:uncharacterized protein (UPF0303 family)